MFKVEYYTSTSGGSMDTGRLRGIKIKMYQMVLFLEVALTLK